MQDLTGWQPVYKVVPRLGSSGVPKLTWPTVARLAAITSGCPTQRHARKSPRRNDAQCPNQVHMVDSDRE